jgi:hypothetical protein
LNPKPLPRLTDAEKRFFVSFDDVSRRCMRDNRLMETGRRDAVPGSLSIATIIAIAVCLALSAAKSLTRDRIFTPDSRNYVNVARNVLLGRGLVQDTVGFGEGHIPTLLVFPQPFAVHGPLYPLAIALTVKTGLDAEDAALLLPWLAAGGAILGAFQLVRRLFGSCAAWWSAGFLCVCYALRHVSGVAWAESPSIALLIFSLLCLHAGADYPGQTRVFLGGILGGLAFAARYPLVLAFPFGVALLMTLRPIGSAIRRAAAFGMGFLLVATPILARNLLLTEHLTGAARNPSTIGFRENLAQTGKILFGQFLMGPGSTCFEASQGLALLVLALLAAWRLRSFRELRSLLLGGHRIVLVLWIFGYALYVAVQRSITHFDSLHARHFSPSHVLLVCVVGVLLAASLRLPARRVVLIVFLAALAMSGRICFTMVRTKPAGRRYALRSSERLRWIKKWTTPSDLIIAERGNDLAFYLDRPSLYFTGYPEMRYVTEKDVRDILTRACPRYANVYMIMRRRRFSIADWRERYGECIADLLSGSTRLVAQATLLQDAIVLRLDCGIGAIKEGGPDHKNHNSSP